MGLCFGKVICSKLLVAKCKSLSSKHNYDFFFKKSSSLYVCDMRKFSLKTRVTFDKKILEACCMGSFLEITF